MKNAKITLTALILVFGISLGCKDTEAAKEQYRHEHAFDGVHEEEKDIYSAATDCNSAAMDVVNAENKKRDMAIVLMNIVTRSRPYCDALSSMEAILTLNESLIALEHKLFCHYR